MTHRTTFAEALVCWKWDPDASLFCELVTGWRVRPPLKVKGWDPTHGWDPMTIRWPERMEAVQERLF